MNAIALELFAAAALFLVAVGTGIWLSRSGKPLNAAIMAVHKIVALVSAVILVVAVYQLARAAEAGPPEWGALAATGLLFLLLGGSGAVLSFDKPVPAVVRLLHKVAPLLAALAAAGTIYLLARGAA